MAVIAVFTVIFLFIPLAKQDKTQQSLTAVLNAVKRLVSFYKEEYRNINVDGLYGLRVVEGHAAGIIQKYESGELHHLSEDIIHDVKVIKAQASTVCGAALQFVKKDDPNYFKQLKFVVSSPWGVFEHMRRKVEFSKGWSSEIYSKGKKVFLNEEQSDKCMAELIGSHKSGGSPCDLSSQCVSTMTAPGLVGYGITHQLLWTMLAEKAGCKQRMEEILAETKRGSLASLRLELCSNNYIQLVNTLKKFPNMIILPPYQDLYLEELFICPSLGFYEFLDIELLPQILSWQHKKGCYGKMSRSGNKDSRRVNLDPVLHVSEYDYDEEDDDGDMIQPVDDLGKGINLTDVIGHLKTNNITGRKLLEYSSAFWDGTVVKGRKLLVEKSMKGGCLAHKTGVASGALVIFLRFLCEPDAHLLFNKTQNKSFGGSVMREDKFVQTDNQNLKRDSGIYLLKRNQSTLEHAKKFNGESDRKKVLKNNEPDVSSHRRVLRQNNPLELQNMQAMKIHEENVNKDKALLIKSQNDIDIKEDHVKIGNSNEHLKKVEDDGYNVHEANQGQQPAVLEAPDDDNDENGDDDEDYDADEDDPDEDDGDGYDDNVDDDGDYNEYDNGKDKVPVEKDPDYVAADDDKDGDYKQEDYDEGDRDDDGDDNDADYDHELKSVEVQKRSDQLHDPANKDILKGHINARNIVNRNDFQSDHDFGDNKRFDDKKRNDDHDRYAYDDNNGDDYDYDDKNEDVKNKDTNADIRLEPEMQSKTTPLSSVQRSLNISNHHTVSSNSALFIFAFCFVSVVLLAYRFIKKRRIHFRFGPRVPYKV